MRNQAILITTLILASCASASPHHRGGYGGGRGEGMPGYQTAPHITRVAGTADADAILFASFDRDGDLLVSGAELDAGIVREFARADSNHDGSVSAAEYQAWSERALGGAYPPYRLDVDRDADGHITTAEFSAALRGRAQMYDRNGDGVIEHAELVRQQSQTSSDDDPQLIDPNYRQDDGQSDSGYGRGGGRRR